MDAAERAYRQAALLKEGLGRFWIEWRRRHRGELPSPAMPAANPGRPRPGSGTPNAFQDAGDRLNLSRTLSNLANLLQDRAAASRNLTTD